MATYIGIGFSREPNTSHAAHEAALQAKTQSEQQRIDLAIVFTSIDYRPLETLRIVRQTLNQSKIIGCSTAGILLSESIELQGIAVVVLTSDDMQFGIGHVDDVKTQDLKIAGNALARNTIIDFGQHRRSAFVLLTDGLLKNNVNLINGAQAILGKVLPIVGGGSSDNLRFKETFQYFQDKPLHQSAVGFLIGGQARVGIGSKHGWKPLGKPRTADETDGEIIKTIDGKRASSIYEEYFDADLKELQTTQLTQSTSLHPLGIYLEGESEYLIRNVREILSDGSIVCYGDIPQGSEIHIMIGNKDFCLEATAKAAKEAKDILLNKPPRLIMVFESAARHKLLRRKALEEIRIIKEIFDPTTPIIGIYTYGEIAPLKPLDHLGEANLLHSTITIMAIA